MATAYPGFESALIVLMNGRTGRVEEFNDWYNNVHIRDCMRMPGATAVQRFSESAHQPTLNGKRVQLHHKHLSLYEWADTRNVPCHGAEAFTEKGVISAAGDTTDVLDYYFNPRVLTNGYSPHAGFRVLNQHLMLARFTPQGAVEDFEDWFRTKHAASTLDLPGFVSAGLFHVAEEQMVALPSPFSHIAIYGLSDPGQAVEAWDARHAAGADEDLAAHAKDLELGVFSEQIARITAEEVLHPTVGAAMEEIRVRRSLERQTFEAATSGGLEGYIFTDAASKH